MFQLFKLKYLQNPHSPIIDFKGLKHFLRDNLFEDFQSDFIINDDETFNRIERFMVKFKLFNY